jgi:hypothetical protein
VPPASCRAASRPARSCSGCCAPWARSSAARGSLANALREAGFDVAVGAERLERAVAQGAVLARELGRLPKFADWAEARKADPSLLTEWQVYRMLDAKRGAWSTFQFLVRERLDEEGVRVATDGALLGR